MQGCGLSCGARAGLKTGLPWIVLHGRGDIPPSKKFSFLEGSPCHIKHFGLCVIGDTAIYQAAFASATRHWPSTSKEGSKPALQIRGGSGHPQLSLAWV